MVDICFQNEYGTEIESVAAMFVYGENKCSIYSPKQTFTTLESNKYENKDIFSVNLVR